MILLRLILLILVLQPALVGCRIIETVHAHIGYLFFFLYLVHVTTKHTPKGRSGDSGVQKRRMGIFLIQDGSDGGVLGFQQDGLG